MRSHLCPISRKRFKKLPYVQDFRDIEAFEWRKNWRISFQRHVYLIKLAKLLVRNYWEFRLERSGWNSILIAP